jgi:hypothetical protein
MTKKRKLISITFPTTGLVLRPQEGEKYIDEAKVDQALSAALKEFGGYSHELIYTYDDGSTEEK